MEGQII